MTFPTPPKESQFIKAARIELAGYMRRLRRALVLDYYGRQVAAAKAARTMLKPERER